MDEKSDSHFENKAVESEQLRRVNQQLEAAHQQLKAEEQQLIAASRKLKAANKQLQESEERYRSLIENIPSVSWKSDQDGNTIFISPNIEGVYGYAPDEIYNKGDELWFARVHPNDREKVKMAFDGLFTKGEKYDVEYRIQRRDGNWIWLHDVAGNISEKDDILYAYGAFSDITERKKAEEALRRSEENYRELANSITDVFFAMDENLKYSYWNKASEKLTGIKVKDAIGKSIFEVFPDNEDTKRAIAVYQKVLKTQRSTSFVNEYRLGDKNFVFGIHAYPTKRGISVFVRDITDRRRAEQALQKAHDELEKRVKERTAELLKANKQLESEIAERKRKEEMLHESEKLAAVGRLAARIAHEINNPLAGIKNSFLLIKDSIPDNHSYYKYVDLIEKEIVRVSDIVRQMYDLYGPVQALESDFRLCEAIVDVVALLKVASEEHKVNINIDIDDGIVVRLPDGLLRQVLFNIIQNAIEASHSHSIVKVTAGICEDVLSMKVIDSGVGIAEDIREKIFEPFFTSKRDDAERSLGLGLSVCKNIVDAIGGEVIVQSRVGKGTTFTINIPLKNKNAESENG